MSIQQAAQAAVSVFPNTSVTTPYGTYSLRVVMVAIAGAESGWDPTANGDCGLGGPSCGSCAGSGGQATSWGLWQIHNVHSAYLTQASGSSSPCGWQRWLFNPLNNAKAAWALYGGNLSTFLQNWTTWGCPYTGCPPPGYGPYHNYLRSALSAVQSAQSLIRKVQQEPAILVPVSLLILGLLGVGTDIAWIRDQRTGHWFWQR